MKRERERVERRCVLRGDSVVRPNHGQPSMVERRCVGRGEDRDVEEDGGMGGV